MLILQEHVLKDEQDVDGEMEPSVGAGVEGAAVLEPVGVEDDARVDALVGVPGIIPRVIIGVGTS